jgi:hypothetical protein
MPNSLYKKKQKIINPMYIFQFGVSIYLKPFFNFGLKRWNFEESTPPANFNRFTVALMTVFQVRLSFFACFNIKRRGFSI